MLKIKNLLHFHYFHARWCLYGTYELSINDPKGGPSVRDTGKLVEIWKKQTDGNWKCIVDIYNSDLPVGLAPEAQR